MELRQLEAFALVAAELHFGRAAQRLHMSQPTLSDLIRKLERELGTPLFARTTRRVALTGAGAELLRHAEAILEDVRAAGAAVRRVAAGQAGTVRLGITPPVSSALAPHLAEVLRAEAPDVELVVQRMWLPELRRAIPEGRADVSITCGLVPEPPGIIGEVFCAEPLVVGLRTDHRLAQSGAVDLRELAQERLGLHSDALFPAWSMALRQVLDAAKISPPIVELAGTDLSACRWSDQAEVDWILTTAAVAGPHHDTRLLPVIPELFVPYTLQWCPIRATTVAVGRFVNMALTADLPDGWVMKSGHLGHRD